MVSFKSGPDIIQGYLARPRKAGRFPAVVVLHGNLHLPEDHRYTAAQLAEVGLVGLAIKRFSRTPELTGRNLIDRIEKTVVTSATPSLNKN